MMIIIGLFVLGEGADMQSIQKYSNNFQKNGNKYWGKSRFPIPFLCIYKWIM